MARPIKQTVDYFSHDADASQGKTLTILENHFGAEGYSVWFKLLETISTTKNHVIYLRNGDETEYLAAKFRIKPDQLMSILTKMADLEAIDKQLFECKIIWCQNFVDRLKDVYDNRRQPLPLRPTITTPDNPIIPPVPTTNNDVIEHKITLESTQSKLKETIVNNIYSLFELWNTNKIVVHQKLTDKMQRKCNAVLKDYPYEDIKKAIENYGEVIAHPDIYFFKYKWTFDDFLQRGLTKFVDNASPLVNFLKGKENGTHRGHNQGAVSDNKDSSKYTKGRYGHLVKH